MFGKDKNYMSYSAYILWKKNKDAYRKHYYGGEKTFDTTETKFGKLIAEALERGDESLKHIPNYASREYDIEVMIDGNRVMGRIDGFDEKRIRFLDHKSAHADKNGNPPWDKLKARKLEQLPFYSMLLKEKFGKVDRVCHLVWIETEFENKEIEFDGHKLQTQSNKLRLTGRVKKFRRVITKWERKRIREDLIKVMNEIKKDYEEYRNK